MKATATEVKRRFGLFLDRAQHEPVVIEKSGREVAVLLSRDEYEQLQKADDFIWGAYAKAVAEDATYIGHEEVMQRLMARLAEIEAEEAADPAHVA